MDDFHAMVVSDLLRYRASKPEAKARPADAIGHMSNLIGTVKAPLLKAGRNDELLRLERIHAEMKKRGGKITKEHESDLDHILTSVKDTLLSADAWSHAAKAAKDAVGGTFTAIKDWTVDRADDIQVSSLKTRHSMCGIGTKTHGAAAIAAFLDRYGGINKWTEISKRMHDAMANVPKPTDPVCNLFKKDMGTKKLVLTSLKSIVKDASSMIAHLEAVHAFLEPYTAVQKHALACAGLNPFAGEKTKLDVLKQVDLKDKSKRDELSKDFPYVADFYKEIKDMDDFKAKFCTPLPPPAFAPAPPPSAPSGNTFQKRKISPKKTNFMKGRNVSGARTPASGSGNA